MKNPEQIAFQNAQNTTLDCLDALQLILNRCVDDGMLDILDEHYNTILVLIDETRICENFDELQEVIAKAKVLEKEIDAWLANHGKTTISMSWPKNY